MSCSSCVVALLLFFVHLHSLKKTYMHHNRTAKQPSPTSICNTINTLPPLPPTPISSNLSSHSNTGYIGEVEIIDDRRAGKVVVNLIGRLNKCGVISPRFDVGLKDIETWTNNLLPSRQFGRLVLTTSAGTSPPPSLHAPIQFFNSTLSLPPPLLTPIAPGIMDHNEARRKSTGGKILGFFY